MLSSNVAASIATGIDIHLCQHLFTLLCLMVSPWTSPFVVELEAHDDLVRTWCASLPWIYRDIQVSLRNLTAMLEDSMMSVKLYSNNLHVILFLPSVRRGRTDHAAPIRSQRISTLTPPGTTSTGTTVTHLSHPPVRPGWDRTSASMSAPPTLVPGLSQWVANWWISDFYASAPKVLQALFFRIVRPSAFFFFAITPVLHNGISSNLI